METRFKFGEVREDGMVFYAYRPGGGEMWKTPENYFRSRISTARAHAKKRAEEKAVPFDVSLDYLVSIFPEDHTCPVLGIPLEFGGGDIGKGNSPSLDRIVPERGYVEGNVMWLSNRANLIKQDATPEELRRVADFYTIRH